ncbi:MAG: hypothetical protein IPM30_10315 [Burkholderiales bacterium]|jgi:hypothetical protein|nr:hypothetical protein [Burkholderiales bacterium]
MSTRKLLLAIAFVGAAAPLSAMAGVDFVQVNGEAGFVLQDAPAVGLTRAEKVALDQAQAAAEAAQLSGWRNVNGEAGWILEGHKYARVNGKFVCVDGIDHDKQASVAPIAEPSIYRGA